MEKIANFNSMGHDIMVYGLVQRAFRFVSELFGPLQIWAIYFKYCTCMKSLSGVAPTIFSTSVFENRRLKISSAVDCSMRPDPLAYFRLYSSSYHLSQQCVPTGLQFLYFYFILG